MKKSLISAAVIAAADIAAVVLLKGHTAAIASVLFVVPFCVLLLLERMSVKNLSVMSKQIEKVEEENRQVEKIRSEFVANVSHELKTPLTSISGFIETLQSGAVDDPEARDRFIDIIAIETARLKRLIDDILLLSDIESRMDNYHQEIDVKSVTESVATMLQPIASEKNITIHNQVEDGFIVYGSEDKFKQMLLNLIENAIKYGNENGNTWVSTETDDDTIKLAVRDDGIGIDEKDIDRIAERFYRVDKSRSTKAGGTGLGLSIVKHTAALFDGELTVKSRPGEGSEFAIVIRKKNPDR